MDVLNHVKQKLDSLSLAKHDKLLIAVSGGMDSMLLWYCLQKLGFDTIAVHINYHLRGEESNADESLVSAFALKNNLALEIFHADPLGFESNLQERARDFRYQKFKETLKKHKASYVLTAHHFNDDLETAFINLIRGSGLSGVKGIQLKNAEFIRPFIDLSKTTLTSYANKVNLLWREDASNNSDKYLRNRIRHHVLPELLNSDERAERGLSKSLTVLKEQDELLKFLIKKYSEESFYEENGLLVLKLTDELRAQKPLLFELIKPFGIFNIDEILNTELSGKKFMSNTHVIWFDRNRLLIESLDKQNLFQSVNIEGEGVVEGICSLRTEFLEKLPIDFKPLKNEAWLDASKLEFPLVLRKWKKGDFFQPFGLNGRKKISDYLSDIKMPVPIKEKCCVLESNGNIVWLVGHRIDEKFKVEVNTKKIYLAKLL